MIDINSKLPHVGRSIFPVMTALANEYGAVNLAQGFPGFGADEQLLKLVSKYTLEGCNQYAPLMGVLSLKEALSKKMAEAGGRYYHPENEICITAGATQAIYSTVSAFVNEGDEVIIFDPSYDCYEPAVHLNKGKAIRLSLSKGDYSINWKEVKASVNDKTRMIIVNNPHNPSGAVWNEKDVEALKAIVKDSDIIVLSDEVYEHLVFDGLQHLSLTKEKELQERVVAVYSFGKTYHLTGWRVGYAVAPKELMNEIVSCHQFQVYAVNTPMQYAIADYSQNKEAYLALNAFFQQKRDYFVSLINETAFKAIVPKGTYFALLDYSSLSLKEDTVFANELTKQYKVASIPISVFFNDHRQDQVLRFCFAKNNDELELAAERLRKVIADL